MIRQADNSLQIRNQYFGLPKIFACAALLLYASFDKFTGIDYFYQLLLGLLAAT